MKRFHLIFFVVSTLVVNFLSACAQTPAPLDGEVQPAATPTELFFSEYVEGSSFNKALEVYNGTGASIALSTYTIELYSNGNATPSQTTSLSGILADGNVYVLAHPSAAEVILAVADMTNGSVLNFNGDDAIVLRKNGTVLDVIGQIGVDPGSEWGSGLTSTQDNTLRRKMTICVGDPDGSDAFDPDPEWDGFVNNTFGGLGSHSAACGPVEESAPTVMSTEPESDALGVIPAADITITFSEPVTVTGDWFSIGCSVSGAHTATASGNGSRFTLDPDSDFANREACTVTVFAADVSDVDGDDPPDTLATDYSFSFATAFGPAKIHEVQGNGDTSPLEGQTVTIEGVVVGDFQAADGDAFGTDLDGFYVQEEDADADNDLATSEGVFVYAPKAADVKQGDLVSLTGEVSEFKGLTEVTNLVSLEVVGTAPLPTATAITLPVTSEDALERFESMYVTFPQALVISEYFNFDRFGEIALSLPVPEDQSRPYQPTSYLDPDTQMAAIDAARDLIDRSRITLDDGRASQNPDPARHPNGEVFDLTNRFRGGDMVQNATGVLDYRFGSYRIQPTTGAAYVQKNPRPKMPDDVGGSLRVASFNVLNYFLTLDDGGNVCSPGGNQECRGADDTKEFERQRAKIISALSVLNADVFGLIELENTPGVEPLRDIVAGLNEATGADYTFVDTGTIGTDAIKVGIIYKPGSVTPLGDYAILDSSDDPRFVDTKNRPALAQTFVAADGGVFTLVVNHFKSKGSRCSAGDDSPVQGNCNLTREQAAEALVDWLAGDPTNSGDPDVLVIGDLNSYDEEDPIDALRAGSDDVLNTGDDFVDLEERFEGEFAYSYGFDGQFGYLDYALASTCLAPQVTGMTTWHINADEPDILDYDTSFKKEAQDALFEPNPYRSSDHDPVLVGLNLYGGSASIFAYFADELERLQADGTLNGGQANALSKKLEQVQKSLGKAKTKTALNQLNAFESQVADFVADGTLTTAQAARLSCLVRALRSALG